MGQVGGAVCMGLLEYAYCSSTLLYVVSRYSTHIASTRETSLKEYESAANNDMRHSTSMQAGRAFDWASHRSTRSK